jgi:hypothetical protein
VLQRLLLLPLITPLLAVLLLGAINPRPWVSVQLLTWRSPGLPLGAWIGFAAAAGAGLSAAATGLALQGGAAGLPAGRRQVRRGPRSRAEDPEAEPAGAPDSSWGGWAGPSRAPSDPPPTVSVPFRVIRRGSQAPARPSGPASSPAPSASPEPAASPATAVVVGDGWDTSPSDAW